MDSIRKIVYLPFCSLSAIMDPLSKNWISLAIGFALIVHSITASDPSLSTTNLLLLPIVSVTLGSSEPTKEGFPLLMASDLNWNSCEYNSYSVSVSWTRLVSNVALAQFGYFNLALILLYPRIKLIFIWEITILSNLNTNIM